MTDDSEFGMKISRHRKDHRATNRSADQNYVHRTDAVVAVAAVGAQPLSYLRQSIYFSRP
ncbi:hypothetical protein KIN20_024115 [Parelaphostrongylus tenuis]|uniref:Uncharacterized protein n=1 Tax=Parelaphostrongylus tenuis TaxID=148309 RepID=A0AAD5QW44_PARTN|nr:hypothetical protein KIN20_024115 [Parelaphostrongylus tenuis]